MSAAQTTPTAETTTPAPGLSRRGLLAGGVLGFAGGLAAGVVGRKPRVWAGDTVVPDSAILSYAQSGEDLVAASLLKAVGVTRPTYLDIGAFDPISDSNTYYFYLAGSRGVLVEPNPAITERLRSVRPGDTVLVAGIGIDDTTEADYYMLDAPGWNTFDKEQAERMAREPGHRIERVVKMPMLGVNRVVAEQFGGKAPDFLSIDIEGLDCAVLKTLDFARYRPKVICSQTLLNNTLTHATDTTDLLVANGYVVRGMTHPNTFYVDKALLGS